jgi:glycosyl transferase family 25
MWPSYVINLARNTQRMDNSARQLDAAGLPWERIEAVNGWDLPEAEVARVYDASRNASDGKQPLVPPEIGCYLSHIAAWERIAEGPDPGGFIFEDDFAADDTLGEKLALLSQPQDDWDMVKLFSFDADAPLEWDKPLGHYRIGMPYRVPTCLIGYGLTREAAAHLAGRARPFFRPVDEDQKFVWETGLRVALILPPPILVGDQSTVTGTIGSERRDARAARGALARGLHNLRYSLRYSWNLARHRRKERRNSAGGGS